MTDDDRAEAAAEMGLCQCQDDYQCEHNSQPDLCHDMAALTAAAED